MPYEAIGRPVDSQDIFQIHETCTDVYNVLIQPLQQMQRRCQKVVTTSDDWLYRYCQVVGSESLGYIVVTMLRNDVVATQSQRCDNVTKSQLYEVSGNVFQRYVYTSLQLLLRYSLESYICGDNKNLKCVNSTQYLKQAIQIDFNTSLTLSFLCWRNVRTLLACHCRAQFSWLI